MKKHFLLLLMAFFSLTGWAQIDISTGYEVTLDGTGAYVYNGVAKNVGLIVQKSDASDPLTAGTDFDVVYYLEDGTTEVAAEDLINAGTYKAAAKGKGDYIGQTPKLTFEITAKPLTKIVDEEVVANDGIAAVIDHEAEGYEAFTYDGTPKEYADGVVSLKDGENTLVAGSTKDYTISYEYNVDAFDPENPGEGEDPAVIVFTGHNNYQGTYRVPFKIAQKEFGDDTEFVIDPAYTNPTYTAAAAETPTFTGTDGETALAATDFTVEWYEGVVDGEDIVAPNWEGVPEAVQPKNVGTYFAKIKGEGGNYTGEMTNDDWKFSITKKDLMIYVQDDSKIYDGEPIAMVMTEAEVPEATDVISGQELVFTGLVDAGDAAAAIKANYVAKFATAYENTTNAGDYNMKPVVVDPDLMGNYNVNAMETGVYTIEKREVKVKALNQEFTYTGEAQALNTVVAVAGGEATATVEITAADATTGVVGVDDVLPYIAISLKEGVTIQEKTNEDYVGAIEISETALGELETSRNYFITGTAGDVIVNGDEITLIAGTFSKEYGYTIDFSNDFKVVNTAGLKKDDWTVAPIYEVKDAANNVYDEGDLLQIGTYTITLTNAQEMVNALGNYDYSADKVYAGELTITAATLDFELATIRLNAGSTETDLNVYKEDAVTFKNLVEGDNLGYKLVFNAAYLNEGEGDAPSTLKSYLELSAIEGAIVEGKLVNAYTLVAVAAEGDEVNANDNYVFPAGEDAIYGKIIVGNANSLYLDPTDTQLETKIGDAANGELFDVTFGEMPMNEKEWYAMVLPFDATLTDIVSTLGTYVVVNKIKSSTIDEAGVVDVQFGLEWDKIEAGVPFLIKPATDIDWAGEYVPGEEPEAEVFVPFVFATNTVSDELNNVATDKATFAGTYSQNESVKWGLDLDGTTADTDAKYRWLAHKGMYKKDGSEYENKWMNPKNNAHALAPMEAYLILDPAATKARIYVEDIDENGATAIKSLSVDKVNGLNVEGMYTIGGMKLQGAPAQKGVYIKDGKKVIIK